MSYRPGEIEHRRAAQRQQRLPELARRAAQLREVSAVGRVVSVDRHDAAQDVNFQKSPNKLATKTLTCDTDRTKARTPKWRPAFGCSRRALPGPNTKKSVATKFRIFASPGNRF